MRTCRAEQNYRERVARVVAFIVAHPMAEHRLEDLAAMVHFSPFHFHRVYSSIAGETVSATVRRVRLALAARLLEQGRHSVTQVALAVGYDSPQAFTRAFQRFTHQSPRAFQRHMHRPASEIDAVAVEDDAGEVPVVRMVERPAQRVHAIRHHGSASTIPHTQRRLHLHPGVSAASAWLGVFYGGPDDVSADFRYYAAAVMPPHGTVADAEMQVFDIPAGRYARQRLVGPYARIHAAVATLYSRWLPASGYQPDDRPALEHYLNSPRTASQAELLTDLFIPVRRAN